MSLRRNISGLAISQIFSYIVPLLQFPYLSRVVGDAFFGIIIFSLSLTQMAMIITDFGFNLSISKKIAEGRNSRKWLGIFLYQTSIIKLGLSLISILFIFTILLASKHSFPKELVIGLLVCVFFNAFNPYWIFQGLEKIYIYSLIVIVIRLLSFGGVYFIIRSPHDYVYYGWILAFQAFGITLTCFLILASWKMTLTITSKKLIYQQFFYSLEFFFSRACVSLYSSGCSVFLGTFGGSLSQVAIYGVAEQLYKAGVQVFGPVLTALTPYMVRTKNYKLFYQIVIVFGLLTTLGVTIGWCWGDSIIRIIYGKGYDLAKPVLDIFMLITIASVFGMLFGYPALMPLGLARVANFSVIVSGLLQILMLLFLYFGVFPITAITVCITYLICDWSMLLIRLYYFLYK